MKWYSCHKHPLQLHGLNYVDPDSGHYWRLPPELLEKMPQYEHLGRRCAGARLRFRTNSPKVAVRYSVSTEEVDRAMALPAAVGIDVYVGTGRESRFVGYVAPAAFGYRNTIIEGEARKEAAMETVTLNLPRNELLSHLEIGIEDDAMLEAPPPYRIAHPIVFYGSSITEGGCAPRPGAAYTSIVSRWLDADYYNYGFSGGAKGEQVFARFIAAHQTMGAFVLDYDHNAPDAAHLEATHGLFFETIRKAHPKVPIIIMTMPDFDWNPADVERRRAIIYDTYLQAVRAGDRNVSFVDGQQLFGLSGREECTVDGCHPNALGFMRMAETLYPLLRRSITLASDGLDEERTE